VSPRPSPTPSPVTGQVIDRDNRAETIVIEIDTGTLPEGAVSLRTADGSVYPLEGASGRVRMEINAAAMEDGTIVIEILGDEETAMGSFQVKGAHTATDTGKPIAPWLWIGGGILLAGGIALTVYLKSNKGKARA